MKHLQIFLTRKSYSVTSMFLGQPDMVFVSSPCWVFLSTPTGFLIPPRWKKYSQISPQKIDENFTLFPGESSSPHRGIETWFNLIIYQIALFIISIKFFVLLFKLLTLKQVKAWQILLICFPQKTLRIMIESFWIETNVRMVDTSNHTTLDICPQLDNAMQLKLRLIEIRLMTPIKNKRLFCDWNLRKRNNE